MTLESDAKLVVWKIIGICQIFTRALESLKIGTLMGFFGPKLKMHELKIYWGVMCHENEEWCKNEMKTLINFNPSTQKSQKFAL